MNVSRIKLRLLFEQLDQPALGLGRAELISNEFGNDTKSSSLVQAYKSFISNAVALISPTTSSQVAAQAADDIVGLETDLAKVKSVTLYLFHYDLI